MRVERPFDDGDALMHALIESGGHDPEFLTDSQLAGAPLRLPVTDYLRWYAELPAALREAVEERWGQPPGDRYVDGDDFVIAGLELGNVLVAIQPPRGYGEDPVGIYHDPELPPTHHYLACYWWIDRVWGADAIVHLGKHGTLEWLPGKMLALSAACAPDAALGDMPLVYPFVVNDPGEGVQAKRRAHAVIVDHLVPPMMRADTYDELAELETLLDEYAPARGARPAQAAGAGRAHLDRASRPPTCRRTSAWRSARDDVGALVEHIDGYLCEVKDIQVKDGLHVLGQAPAGRAAARARLRRCCGSARARCPGCGGRSGPRSAWTSRRWSRPRAPPRRRRPPSCWSASAGPAASAGDLVDRLEAAQMALLDALAERRLGPGDCRRGLRRGARPRRRRRRARAALRRGRGRAAHPRHGGRARRRRRRAPRPPRAGRPLRQPHARAASTCCRPAATSTPSTRARCPPSCPGRSGSAWPTPLLDRHRREAGELPRMVGLVAWGTSAMRTAGRRRRRDPRAARRAARPGIPSRGRVTGIEVIPLEELGRPRIDVTVRISGFFRDAFPHLVRLLDDAVATVAALDEPAEENYVAAHARADAERLAAELGEGAWRQATTRVFGSKPGTYGAGLLQLLDARDWRDDGDIAEVYEAWGGYAYGRGPRRGAGARRPCATATRASRSR